MVGRIGLSRSYKPSAPLKRRTFSLKHGVCSKGAADMHVSWHVISTTTLLHMRFYPWYVARFRPRALFFECGARTVFVNCFIIQFLGSMLIGKGRHCSWQFQKNCFLPISLETSPSSRHIATSSSTWPTSSTWTVATSQSSKYQHHHLRRFVMVACVIFVVIITITT